jgi:hypothetical protein
MRLVRNNFADIILANNSTIMLYGEFLRKVSDSIIDHVILYRIDFVHGGSIPSAYLHGAISGLLPARRPASLPLIIKEIEPDSFNHLRSALCATTATDSFGTTKAPTFCLLPSVIGLDKLFVEWICWDMDMLLFLDITN